MCFNEDCPDFVPGREGLDFQEAPHCAVGQSTICASQGLFALRKFSLDDVVVDYSDADWSRCLFENIPTWYRNHDWWIGESEATCLLGALTSVFMRANHSRTPNTYWNTAQRKLTALRDIQPGEEITYDYRLELAPPHFKCNPPPWA